MSRALRSSEGVTSLKAVRDRECAEKLVPFAETAFFSILARGHLGLTAWWQNASRCKSKNTWLKQWMGFRTYRKNSRTLHSHWSPALTEFNMDGGSLRNKERPSYVCDVDFPLLISHTAQYHQCAVAVTQTATTRSQVFSWEVARNSSAAIVGPQR